MSGIRWGPRRVTREDFAAIDAVLDECVGEPLPKWALDRITQILRYGVGAGPTGP